MEQRRHRVHFSYWLHAGVWCYCFIDTGRAVLGPVRRTHDPEKLRGIAQRGGGFTNLEASLMFNYGIRQGRGGLYLMLNEDQYAGSQ
jgi:hypothetical protein